MNLNNGTGSTGVRLPMMRTASAPTALPMKPTRSIGYPAAAQGAVTPRYASPAPIRSITSRESTGTVQKPSCSS